jgi:mono/diheme cytochrome c family protein
MASCTPIWLSLAFAAWLVPSCTLTARAQSADFESEHRARLTSQSGEEIYATLCQACHMEGGVGAAGAYPALAGNPKLASAAYPLSIIVNGRRGMPPFGSTLTDQQVAAVVNYVRTHFGNEFADPITPADASAARR